MWVGDLQDAGESGTESLTLAHLKHWVVSGMAPTYRNEMKWSWPLLTALTIWPANVI